MRVLIYGARGWIGGQMIELLEADGHTAIVGEARLGGANPTEAAALEAELDKVRPTHVLLTLGRTHGPGEGTSATTIDYLEGSPERLRLNVRDNLEAPLQAAAACASRSIHLTYIGTGCIYHYDDKEHRMLQDGGRGFTEEDPPNFFGSSYSVVKGTTDGLLRRFPGVLNARIRMPVGDTDHPRNFINKITTYSKVVNIPNSMTVMHDLLPILVRLMKKEVVGPLNLVNPEPVSHNQILELYTEIVDPGFTWTNFGVEEQNTILSAKRSNCALDASLLMELAPDVKPTLVAVRECMQNIARCRKGIME